MEKHIGKSRNNISPRTYICIPFVIIAVICISVLTIICNIDRMVDAAEQIVSEDGKYIIPSENESSPKGSEDNPFVVLEIVPAEYKARMPYLVAGEEPIDVQRALDSEYDETMKYLGEYIQFDERGKYYNPDLFKKLCIGLGYIENDLTKGEDTSRYMFLGWYLEKECVNPVTDKTRITGNTMLYAKWRTMYPTDEANMLNGDKNKPYMPTYQITFDGNCSETEAASLVDMPENITFIEPGSSLVNPVSLPKIRGKLFNGWYTDKECTNAYSFDAPVTSDITLYAGWVKIGDTRYTINFESNIPDGADASDVSGMPESITGCCENGCLYDYNNNNGKYRCIVPENEPVLSDYVFTGWYYDAACTQIFEDASAVLKNYASDNKIVTLYAGWKPSNDTYTISLDGNKPANAVFDVVIDYNNVVGNNLTVRTGSLINTEVKNIIPSLDGNVEKKVRDYHVKVITTTPEDYYDDGACYNPNDSDNAIAINKYKDNNLKLVDRADLIVVNQGEPNIYFDRNKESDKYSFMLDYMYDGAWRTDRMYHYNHSHGNKGDQNYQKDKAVPYLFGTYNQKFSIDMSWELTMRIFKKTAVGSKEDGSDKCPVLFDYYSIDEANLQDVQNFEKIPYKTSDGKTVYLENGRVNGWVSKEHQEHQMKASKENIFKLYLLTQQMNPTTIYNAYLGGNAEYAKICTEGDNAGCFMTYDENGNEYYTDVWTSKTLFPFEVLTEEEFNTYYSELYGYKGQDDPTGITETLGFDDFPKINENVVNNGMLVTVKGDSEFPDAIGQIVNRTTVIPDEGMKNYIPDDVKEREGYNTTNALYYLINVKATSDSAVSKDINILEIEPADGDGSFKSDSYWFWYINRYIGNYTGTINSTKTSSWEFVGNIEDLNSRYDMIYIGTNMSGMRNEINQLIPYVTGNFGKRYSYAHNGSIFSNDKLKSRGGTLGEQDSNSVIKKFITSGNDLTNAKYKTILEYADAGYPVIFGKGVLDSLYNDDKLITSDSINTDVIDKASYVYKLIYTMLNEKSESEEYVYRNSLFFDNCTDSEKNQTLKDLLLNKKFELKISSMPIKYVDRTCPEYKDYTDEQIYINGENINNKSLEYKFRISGVKDRNYSVYLYIDSNADGKFYEEEKLDSIDIYDVTSEKRVRYNKLAGEHTYTLKRDIDKYSGAIPWKLEVVDNTNKLIRSSITGQCAIKVAEKTVLNILQIVSNSINGSFMNNVYLPTDEEISSAVEKNGEISLGNMTEYFNNIIEPIKSIVKNDKRKSVLNNSGMFHYYLSMLDEFEVHFDRMTVNDFQKTVRDENEYNKGVDENEQTDFMKKYNMLIIGYADCYDDINEEACNVIEKFIYEGKTTLFTHDTTSFVNMNKNEFDKMKTGEYYWGYNINRHFRNILGMDRYDVINNQGNASFIDEDNDSYDKPYKTGTKQSEKNYEKSDNKVLNQGLTNIAVTYDKNKYPTSVSKTNDGQIVSYPYYIPDSISVAPTHSQYYQLDFEDDDIVVWYCIKQTDNDQYYYSIKNDVRNNYYIYNKGNITFSGAGHSSGMTADEIKLFINTMIASYDATVLPAEPFVTNSDKSSDSENTDYVYVDYDSTVSFNNSEPFGAGVFPGYLNVNGEDVTTKRIFFKVKNNSIALNKKIAINYYPVVVDDNGNKIVLSDYPLELKTYRVEDNDKKEERNNSGGILLDGYPVYVSTLEEYYVDIPISDNYYRNIKYNGNSFDALDNKNSFMFQICASMTYGKEQSKVAPLIGTHNVNIMRRGMFSLD